MDKNFIYIPKQENKNFPKFVSVHIPKTGGRTFINTILFKVFGKRNVLNENLDMPNVIKYFINKEYKFVHNIPKNPEKFIVVSGHFKPSKYSFLKRPYITWIRNPVTRTISKYYSLVSSYNKYKNIWNKKEKEDHAWFKYFHEGIDLIEFSELFDNYMSYFFDIELDNYIFIGVLEKYYESLRKFGFVFNLKIPYTQEKMNVRGPYNVNKDIKKKLIKNHEKDFEVYYNAMKIFDRIKIRK